MLANPTADTRTLCPHREQAQGLVDNRLVGFKWDVVTACAKSVLRQVCCVWPLTSASRSTRVCAIFLFPLIEPLVVHVADVVSPHNDLRCTTCSGHYRGWGYPAGGSRGPQLHGRCALQSLLLPAQRANPYSCRPSHTRCISYRCFLFSSGYP